jgi:hypothetical protein
MTVNEWTAIVGLVLAILAAVYSSMRFMVKSIMKELTPNSGKSLKDQVSRIEQRLDQLILEMAFQQNCVQTLGSSFIGKPNHLF